MARPSSIDRLAPELGRLIRDRRHNGATIEEIRTELLERGTQIPRSTLQRHTARLDLERRSALREDIRAIRAGVETIAAQALAAQPVSSRSTVSRLPAALRELIGSLRRDGRTIDEILAKLRELDVQVSRSALARHIKKLDAIGAQLHHSRAIAEALVARFGDEPDSRMARLNIEMLYGLITRFVGAELAGEGAALTPREFAFMSEALARLSQAEKSDIDRTIAIRREFAREAAAKVEEVGRAPDLRAKGLSPEAIQRIRAAVLGLASRPQGRSQKALDAASPTI